MEMVGLMGPGASSSLSPARPSRLLLESHRVSLLPLPGPVD